MSIDEIEARLFAHNIALTRLSDALGDVIGKRHHADMASLVQFWETFAAEHGPSDHSKWIVDELRDVFAQSLEPTDGENPKLNAGSD